MMTHKGRVVYDRKPHLFTEKDLARITKQLAVGKKPKELARFLWAHDLEIIKMQVIDDEAILEFLEEFLALILAWSKDIATWVWQTVLNWFGYADQQPVAEDLPGESVTEE